MFFFFNVEPFHPCSLRSLVDHKSGEAQGPPLVRRSRSSVLTSNWRAQEVDWLGRFKHLVTCLHGKRFNPVLFAPPLSSCIPFSFLHDYFLFKLNVHPLVIRTPASQVEGKRYQEAWWLDGRVGWIGMTLRTFKSLEYWNSKAFFKMACIIICIFFFLSPNSVHDGADW